MATRQYIGARYVPKFYTNSVDGSAAWESNVVYEPLTYVTLTNGHMYISKKQVPATVGTPASNAEYWLDVGSYNGFIDDLQQQISALVTDVNAKANMVSIAPVEDGDNTIGSYSAGDEFYRNGVLYKAKTTIAANTAFSSLVPNTDYEAAPTVSSEIKALTNDYNTVSVMLEGTYVTPMMYGGVGDGVTDDTSAVQSALTAAKTDKKLLFIPRAYTFLITSPLVIDENYICMRIDGTLKASGCDAIHIDGEYIFIEGTGFIEGDGSHIGVLIGGASKTKNCNYNGVRGVTIGHFDIGVNIYNDQAGGLTAYFNELQNMSIYRCRCGIELDGSANAEQISTILFTNCGNNDTTGGAIVCKNIGANYTLDNSVMQIFHHFSANAITLNIEKAAYSHFTDIICEQSGSTAKSLVISDNNTSGCIFNLASNVTGGKTVPKNAYLNNIIEDIKGSASFGKLTVATSNSDRMKTAHRYYASGIAENTNLVLFTIANAQYPIPYAVHIRALIGSSTYVAALHSYVDAIIYVPNLTGQSTVITGDIGTKSPTLSGNDVIVNVGNNGTATTRGQVYLEIEFLFDNDNLTDTLPYTVGSAFNEI